MTDWGEFFLATAGASAALAGLIIVAMSVSVELIVAIPGMPSRAASAIALLVITTVVSLAGLIPEQSLVLYGIETVVLGAGALAISLDAMVRVIRARATPVPSSAARTIIAVVPAACFVGGGILLITGSAVGASLIAFGSITAILASVVIAWVILIEIKR